MRASVYISLMGRFIYAAAADDAVFGMAEENNVLFNDLLKNKGRSRCIQHCGV